MEIILAQDEQVAKGFFDFFLRTFQYQYTLPGPALARPKRSGTKIFQRCRLKNQVPAFVMAPSGYPAASTGVSQNMGEKVAHQGCAPSLCFAVGIVFRNF